ncbi:MAG TPA: hypothetical protein VHZ29_19035 [Rhizomicrobium sp.]|jgi:hypothetical protein|nr:hypothetical protein [Rhizomicrobium sp.]
MRSIVPAMIAGFAVLLSVPAFAGDTSQPVAVAQQPVAVAQPAAAAGPGGEKEICRMMYHNGMLVKTQTCHTQAQWDDMRRSQERDVSDFQNRNFQTSSGH